MMTLAATIEKSTHDSNDGKGGNDDTKIPSMNNGNKENTSSARRVRTMGGSGKTYIQLVQDAIVALKDRTGSSLPAISKWILTEYPDLLGPQFKGRLLMALKAGIKSQRLTKVKCSYKISQDFMTQIRAEKKKNAAKVKRELVAKEQRQKQAIVKAQELEKEPAISSAVDLAKAKADLARKAEAARRKAEADARAREIADRLRRRRFPMEDSKLHAEDKELGVKQPADVTARPYLPYFWQCTLPLRNPSRSGKTSDSVLRASKVDGLDHGNWGLVSDLLQVYHFFRGDVSFVGADDDSLIVPEFHLKHLIHAVEQVLIGNAKRCRLVPPLIVHLFVKCLQILCQEPDDTVTGHERKLRKDLNEYLAPALTPASWSDVCLLYMDAMQRFYTTDVSTSANVLPSLAVDVEYLLGRTDEFMIAATPTEKKEENGQAVAGHLPEGYHGYFGDPRGVLYKAQQKLARQDPWLLTAEELMALLRALTDDILATNRKISDDIAAREDGMQELLRTKRAAENKFRKVRVAFEGPKKPKKIANAEEIKISENGGNEEKTEEKAGEEHKSLKPIESFKPTATQKQFESAKKALQKASDAYDKGIRKLVARTESTGFDRNFNAVYYIRQDPEMLLVEDSRAPSGVAAHLPADVQFDRRSWHVIETTSLFDVFASSLDIRGTRENNLYEELLGPPGAQQSLRRFLSDDIKERAEASSRLKEKVNLQKKLEIARIKCDEERRRRSGRLASQAEEELMQVEAEIAALEAGSVNNKVPAPPDYAELTGLELLRRFDSSGRIGTRRAVEKKLVKSCASSRLRSTGNIDGSGVIGMLVFDLFEVEEICEALAPWERKDITRSAWLTRLESAIAQWNGSNPDPFASMSSLTSDAMEADDKLSPVRDSRRESLESAESSSKRRRVDTSSTAVSTPGATSVASIIALIKQPLLDLEERVSSMTNLDVAVRDADLADDSISKDDAGDNNADQQRLDRTWKKFLYRIRATPTKRHVQIRELLVSAINAARKCHRSEIVSELRSALLLHHPNAAGECKFAAIAVLDAHGGFAPDDEDDEVDDDDVQDDSTPDEDLPSVVAVEAAILKSCLTGSSDATRADWIEEVKSVKTVSRLASLTSAFARSAISRLKKLEAEHDAFLEVLASLEKAEERRAKGRGGKKPLKSSSMTAEPSEVWANVRITHDICMAKAEDYPWWPARKCQAKDPAIAKSLSNAGRVLVAFIGEMGGLRVVSDDSIKPFTGEPVEGDSISSISRDMRTELEDCLAMARRIARRYKSSC